MRVQFIDACKTAISDMNKAKEEIKISKSNIRFVKPVISPATKQILEHLAYTIQMITFSEHANDYKACVTEAIVDDIKAVSGKFASCNALFTEES